MPPTSCLLVLVLVLVLAISPALIAANATAESVYDALQHYGFPPGLVPKDVVTTYELNPSSGQFTVYLNTSCRFTAYHYDVQFKTEVSGVIKKDEIQSLHGVQVRILNYWSNIVSVEMVEDDDEVEFSVGFTAADLPVNYFYNLPACGCGFDCGKSVAGDWSS